MAFIDPTTTPDVPGGTTPPTPPGHTNPPVTPPTGPINFHLQTNTNITVNQSNTLFDDDTMNPPIVQNLGNLLEVVTATGANATSSDGILNGIGAGALTMIGDDMVMTGVSSASANADAEASAATQMIQTGANNQTNAIGFDIVGSHDSDSDIGSDDNGTNVVGTTALAASGGTLTDIDLTQQNTLSDIDGITSPQVLNQFNNVGGGAGSSVQSATATGGTADAGNGIAATVGSAVSVNTVGDDLSMAGSSSAASNAAASAEAFTQDIETGRNQQFNVASVGVVGLNRNTENVGEDKAQYSGVLQDNNIATGGTTTTVAGDPNIADDPTLQRNIATDTDTVSNATVQYTSGDNGGNPLRAGTDDVLQVVDANGAAATAENGIETAAGGVLAAVLIEDDATISGYASASSDATASAEAFTQLISTGGNVQVNQLAVDIVGASQNLSSIGEDGVPRSAAFGDAGNGPVDTLTLSKQSNSLSDRDTVSSPQVRNDVFAQLDGNHLPVDAIRQTVTADGGTATAENGISNGSNAAMLKGVVGDNLSILGETDASASAVASAEIFTQGISTGGNVQFNALSVDVVGGNQTLASVGEDRSGPSNLNAGLNVTTAQIATDTRVELDQHNALDDGDNVSSPTVFNNSETGVVQSVTADGGHASTGSGIASNGVLLAGSRVPGQDDVGDDLSLIGSAWAESDATASAEAFTQVISTGGNVQVNNAAVSVIGANQTQSSTGHDDGAQGNFYQGGLFVPAMGTYGTTTQVTIDQVNNGGGTVRADDADTISNALVENDSHASNIFGSTGADPKVAQTVTATGGFVNNGAFTGDGINGTALFFNGPNGGFSIGDDGMVEGHTETSADAIASAEAFTQDLETGRNTQQNAASVAVIGANQNSVNVGQDDAGIGQDLLMGGYNSKTDTDVHANQANSLNDGDLVSTPVVLNAGATLQTVSASGGIAGLANNTGNGIELGTSVSSVIVGDDLDIGGSSIASADAAASAEAFTQAISTGGNVQVNSLAVSVVGAGQNLMDTGEDGQVPLGVFGLIGSGAVPTDITANQSNNVADLDTVSGARVDNLAESPLVNNVPSDAVVQDVTALGGTATAGNGVIVSGNDAFLTASIGDDLSLAGTAAASASAKASAELFTQDISTGGNVQFNAFSAAVVGGFQNLASSGEDRDGAIVVTAPNYTTQPVLTTSMITPTQTNVLDDRDIVTSPRVFNASESAVLQDVSATGGTARSGDGIDVDSWILRGGDAYADDVGDDLSIVGATSARADASASAEAFTQVIATGGNVMVNNTAISVVGANQMGSSTGHDDGAQGAFLQGNLAAPANATLASFGAKTTIDVTQSNGTVSTLADDQDEINNPLVQNDRHTATAGPDDPNVEQKVAAMGGGTASAGNGIDVGTSLFLNSAAGITTILDDALVAGSADASADAMATAEAFTQDLESGRNTQQNAVTAAIVGANKNDVSVGHDDLAGGADIVMGGYNFAAVTTIDVDQDNHLNDQDRIITPQVINDGDVRQGVPAGANPAAPISATGGNATAGDGINGGTAAGNLDVGDDFEVDGSSIASADAIAYAEAFTQVISTGGNVQINSAAVSVVGINDTTQDVGHDDLDDGTDILPNSGLAPIILPLNAANPGQPVAGTDSTFTFDQVNALYDNDTVSNAQVINTISGDVTQVVSALGGTAFAGEGIDGGVNGLLGTYHTGDNFVMNGTSSASADASAIAEAFTQNIVMGANVQVNALSVSVVGGSSTVSTVGEDDLGV